MTEAHRIPVSSGHVGPGHRLPCRHLEPLMRRAWERNVEPNFTAPMRAASTGLPSSVRFSNRR